MANSLTTAPAEQDLSLDEVRRNTFLARTARVEDAMTEFHRAEYRLTRIQEDLRRAPATLRSYIEEAKDLRDAGMIRRAWRILTLRQSVGGELKDTMAAMKTARKEQLEKRAKEPEIIELVDDLRFIYEEVLRMDGNIPYDPARLDPLADDEIADTMAEPDTIEVTWLPQQTVLLSVEPINSSSFYRRRPTAFQATLHLPETTDATDYRLEQKLFLPSEQALADFIRVVGYIIEVEESDYGLTDDIESLATAGHPILQQPIPLDLEAVTLGGRQYIRLPESFTSQLREYMTATFDRA